MLDYENIDRRFLRLQLQSKLFLNGREERRTGRFGRRRAIWSIGRTTGQYRPLAFVWRPPQLELILARKSGLVEDDAARNT